MSKRIAITVLTDRGVDSIIETRQEKAEVALVVDSDTGRIVDKLDSTQDIGDVTTVISSWFRHGTYKTLLEAGVEMWIAPGGITIPEALDKFAAGSLHRCTLADIGRRSAPRKQNDRRRWYKKYRSRKCLAILGES